MTAKDVEKILIYSIQAVIGIGLLYFIIKEVNSPPLSKQFAERFKSEKFNLIVQDKRIEGRETYFDGADPITHQKIVYQESIGCMRSSLPLINKGDTIFKRAGTYFFAIKSKNGVQIIPWTIFEKTYQDTLNR